MSGYKPKGNKNSDGLEPPNENSSISKKENSKSIGTIIDELLNNPEVIMVQAGRVINEAKKAEEKILNKNKELEKLSKDIRTLENLLDQDVLPSDMNDKEYLQYKEIKDRIFALEKNYEAFLNDYNIGYYGVLGLKYLNNQSPEYLENPVTFRSISLSNFQHY